MPSDSTDLFGDPNPSVITQVCTTCKLRKLLDEFRTARQGKYGRKRRWRECKTCMAARMKRWNLSDHGRTHRKKRKCANYGLTLNEYNEMFHAQGGQCAICGTADLPIDPRTGKLYELAIDHCHKSGKVRALLCHHCNVGLGGFRDDPVLLHAAIAYLKRYSDIC